MLLPRRSIWLLSLTFALLPAAEGQSLSSVLSAAAGKPASKTVADPLGRDTPQNSIYHFLEACHDNKLSLAAQYLDSSRLTAAQGPEVARDLCGLLDRDAGFEVHSLSDEANGNAEDGLPANVDYLDSLDNNGSEVALHLTREARASGVQAWVVSPDSVAQIPALASSLGESSIEKYLPAPLISIRLLGTALWIWIALVLLGLLLAAVSRLLSRLTLALLRPLTSKFTGALHAHRIEEFTEPLRLLLTVVIFRACMGVITPSALLRERINYVLLLLFVLGCAALTMRIVDVLADKVISRLDPRQRSLSYSVIPLTARFLKICVFCIAAILLLQNWGVNVTTILAGVGVGGLAVALAAQKTLENLFGGISVLTDRPVLVGDFCQFGGQVGTVEDIGLRSTRIRTLDRTVVTIPNSTFSAMTLENYARRDRIWFHPTLHLRRDSSADQIRAMMTMLEEILRRHPKVDAGGYPVRFVKIDAQSYDLEIFAYLLTPDFDEFLKFQSEILLEFVEAGAHVGISFAVPLQESVVALHDFAERESQRSGEAGRHDAVELESLK